MTTQVQRVSHDSHVNIRFLTNEEAEERLRNVQKRGEEQKVAAETTQAN